MGFQKSNGVIVWQKDDYRNVAKAIAPLMREGLTLQEASLKAQEVLPKAMRQKRTTLTSAYVQTKLRSAALENSFVTEAMLAQAKAESRRGVIRWLPPEWALIARRVKYWRTDLGDKRPVAKLVHDAAVIELPVDRQRNFNSIQATTNAVLEQAIKDHGKKSDLLANLPAFDPNKTGTAVFEFVDEAKLTQAEAPVAKPQAKAPAEAPAKPATGPQAAPKPSAPTSATPHQFGTLPGAHTEAQGLTFTVTAGPAVVELMRGMIEQAVAKQFEVVTPQLVAQVTSHLQTGIAGMLNHFLDAKPGDVIAAPPAPAVPTPEPEKKADAPQIVLPLLDVVGLIGPQINTVKDAINGHASRVRFVDANHVATWQPRRVVILNTKFISHDATFKCKKAGVKPINVHGGADAVLRALNELWMQEAQAAGVDLATGSHH